MSHRIITSIAANLVCSNGPYHASYAPPEPPPEATQYVAAVECNWEPPRDASDMRPTFADAIWTQRKATKLSFNQLCAIHQVSEAACKRVRHAVYVPSPTMKARLAAMLGMHPDQIRWPVLAKEAH